MRVMLYLKHFAARGEPLIGGTSTAVHGLASGLAQNGAEVTVLCEGSDRSSVTTAAGYRIECFENRRRYRSFSLAPGLRRFATEQGSRGRSLCLVNGMFHPGAYAMGKALETAGVPYVVAPHDPYDRAVFRKNRHLKWPYWYLFEKRLLSRASAVQVLDARHAEPLRSLGVDVPLIEAPNGVTPDSAPSVSLLSWPRERNPVRVLFLGRIDAYNKGLDTLVDALPRVSDKASVHLTIQGPDWGDRARLEKRARAWAVADKIAFVDADYGRSALQIIGDHDILCLPSRFEGFGLTALEAMLVARVVLITERAGIARHVRVSGCGLTIRPTVSGIEAGLLQLIQRRDEWREMGLSGRRYALEHLQWKQIAAAALHQYRRLLS